MMHGPSFSPHSIFSCESVDNILLLAHPYCCDLCNQYKCLCMFQHFIHIGVWIGWWLECIQG